MRGQKQYHLAVLVMFDPYLQARTCTHRSMPQPSHRSQTGMDPRRSSNPMGYRSLNLAALMRRVRSGTRWSTASQGVNLGRISVTRNRITICRGRTSTTLLRTIVHRRVRIVGPTMHSTGRQTTLGLSRSTEDVSPTAHRQHMNRIPVIPRGCKDSSTVLYAFPWMSLHTVGIRDTMAFSAAFMPFERHTIP